MPLNAGHPTRRAVTAGLAGAAAAPAALACRGTTEPSPGASRGDIAAIAWSPEYRIRFFGIERLHPFDIGKYDRIAASLVASGAWREQDFLAPGEVDEAVLRAVHTEAYLASLRSSARIASALELPAAALFPAGLLDRRVLAPMRRAVQGTVLAVQRAVDSGGVAINIGGGYHHARPDLGHGFCIYNDVACALRALTTPVGGLAVVFDTDAHQGDGNHASFAGRDDVEACSLHQRGIFPQPGVPGDLDVELAAGTGDDAYLTRLDDALDEMVTRRRPALVVHVAGADVLHDDPLTDLGVTPDGLVERDLRVARAARTAGAALVHLLAGGYGPSAAGAQARSLAALVGEFGGTG